MKTTRMIYIAMGVLFVVPLILFNIRKIWVRRPPNPVKFKLSRFLVITVLSLFILTFLITAYHETIRNRYEIWTEKVAEKQAEVLVGSCSVSDFRDFVVKNGTENAAASVDAMTFPDAGQYTSVSFQFTGSVTPSIWGGKDYFEQVPYDEGADNPIYVLYMLDTGDGQQFYVIRLVKDGSGWKYDYIGGETETQKDKLNGTQSYKLPNENGKKYTVGR